MTFKEELIEILNAQLESLKAIRELSYKKTDVIINNQVDELENITKREVELINKMALLEKERLNLLNTWGVGKDISLSEIIERIPEDKEDLLNLSNELKSFLKDIQSRNDMNMQLIKDNLEWLEFNINIITQAATPATYDKKKKDSKARKTIFDRKV